jgi:hypothetical protein
VVIHNCTSGQANDNIIYYGFGLAIYEPYIGGIRIFFTEFSTTTTRILVFD